MKELLNILVQSAEIKMFTTFVYINLYNQTYQNQLGMSNDTSFDKTNVARKLQININLK